MKKVLALIMAVLMLTSAGIALADVDTTIAFQGIPWGSSVLDVIDALLDSGIAVNEQAWSEQFFQERLTSGELLTPESGEYFHYNQDMEMYEVESNDNQYLSKFEPYFFLQYAPDKTIAGYGIKGIDFSFVQQGDETRLMTVQVRLDWQDTKAAYAICRPSCRPFMARESKQRGPAFSITTSGTALTTPWSCWTAVRIL